MGQHRFKCFSAMIRNREGCLTHKDASTSNKTLEFSQFPTVCSVQQPILGVPLVSPASILIPFVYLLKCEMAERDAAVVSSAKYPLLSKTFISSVLFLQMFLKLSWHYK